MEIKKGDKFLCIKDVKMAITPEFNNPHTRGEIYTSDEDGHITNNYGGWTSVLYFFDFKDYFKPLKDVDRMYTDATGRLRELHRNFTGNKIGNPDVADYFDNKDVNNEDFAFSAQWGAEGVYEESGYDYVSEGVFIELNGLEKYITKEEQEDYEGYIGRRVKGFKFDNHLTCPYVTKMDDYIGVIGTIVDYRSDYNTFEVKFEDDSCYYPADLVIKQLEQEDYDVRKSVISNKKDEIVQNVVQKYEQRSELGIKKYNTTLQENSDGIEVFLTHLQEELMDATLYIEKLKQQVKQLKDVI